MSDPADLYPDLFEEIVRRRRAGERTVLATVVALKGSTPRDVGARMLVLEDGSIRGTVGGGVRESEVAEAARDLFESGGSALLSVDFHDGLTGGQGPVCGGMMEVFMERIDPPRRVVIAGAGHVGYFVHRFLRLLDIHPVVFDPRPDQATAERFPEATLVVRPFESGLEDLGLGPGDGVVIVTPGHTHDEDVLRQALATPAGYIGMIGSKKKVATVFERLRKAGFTDEDLARVHSPIGLDIGAETPAEIGLAISAEVLSVFRG